MKVAVSASGDSLDDPVDPRFGRCQYFIIVDTDSMKFEAIPNINMKAPSGAGIGAAQLVTERGVKGVVTGAAGPNAMAVLSQAGIRIYIGAQGSVRQAIKALERGELCEASSTGGGSFGGRGGRGMGRGMGHGMGRGIDRSISVQTGPVTREQQKEDLQKHLEQLERQLREVKKRLEELER